MGVRLHVRSSWGASSDDEDEVVYEFDQDRIVIGRGRGADVCLPHRAVSVRHATVELSANGYTLVDHDSTNGTRIAGVAIVPGRPKPLRDADVLDVGGFSITFRTGVAVSSPTSSERTASLARRLLREELRPREDALVPTFTILNGAQEGQRFVLPEGPTCLLIGRGENCDIRLNDADASREHAEVDVAFYRVRVRDLDSKNGIFIGERAVRERVLSDREEFRIGSTVLRFEDPAGARVEALEQEEDASYEPPEPEVEPEPEEVEALPHSEPSAPAPPAPKVSIAPVDMVVYVLASLVFGVSVLGLAWLLRS